MNPLISETQTMKHLLDRAFLRFLHVLSSLLEIAPDDPLISGLVLKIFILWGLAGIIFSNGYRSIITNDITVPQLQNPPKDLSAIYNRKFKIYSLEDPAIEEFGGIPAIPITIRKWRKVKSYFDFTLSAEYNHFVYGQTKYYPYDPYFLAGCNIAQPNWCKAYWTTIAKNNVSNETIERDLSFIQNNLLKREIGKLLSISSTLKDIEQVKSVVGKCRKSVFIVRKKLLHPMHLYVERALGTNMDRAKYFISDATIFPVSIFILVREHMGRMWGIEERFERFIQFLFHSGIYNFWEQLIEFQGLVKYRVESVELQPIKLIGNIGTIFVILIVLSLVCFIVFVLEMIIFKASG